VSRRRTHVKIPSVEGELGYPKDLRQRYLNALADEQGAPRPNRFTPSAEATRPGEGPFRRAEMEEFDDGPSTLVSWLLAISFVLLGLAAILYVITL
jgi:hypothetical protein